MSGWALAYLCQFEIARLAHVHQAPVAQAGWVAQIGLHNLLRHPQSRLHGDLWSTWMNQDALPLAARYVAGDSIPPRALVTLAWRLAHLDSLCRQPLPPWPALAALPTPRGEHLRQITLWWHKWKQGLPPITDSVLLNADLASAGCVRHGENALIVGQTLLATHVLKETHPLRWAHRLAGQAVWLERKGLHGGPESWPIRFVRICFVRAGGGRAWHGWDLDELFTPDDWDRYSQDILRAAHR